MNNTESKVISGMTIGASVIVMAQTSTAIAAYNTGTENEKNTEINKWSYGLAILVLIVSLALFIMTIYSVTPKNVKEFGRDIVRRTGAYGRDMVRQTGAYAGPSAASSV